MISYTLLDLLDSDFVNNILNVLPRKALRWTELDPHPCLLVALVTSSKKSLCVCVVTATPKLATIFVDQKYTKLPVKAKFFPQEVQMT